MLYVFEKFGNLYTNFRFLRTRTLVVQKKIKELWGSNITHVTLYSIYNVRSYLHVVQKRYKGGGRGRTPRPGELFLKST